MLFRLDDGVTVPPWSRFQFPPHQTERADFPHSAFLSASPQAQNAHFGKSGRPRKARINLGLWTVVS
jgi:hypothetical protein